MKENLLFSDYMEEFNKITNKEKRVLLVLLSHTEKKIRDKEIQNIFLGFKEEITSKEIEILSSKIIRLGW